VAAGIGGLLEAVPAVELLLKLVGSAYLLCIAFLVVGSGAVGRTTVSRPLSLWQAVAFQRVHPKAWIFAVAAVGTFLPPELHRLVDVGLLTSTLMGRRGLDRPRSGRSSGPRSVGWLTTNGSVVP
jgi:threonine/homoserine/homoserine lactone efflux protein